MGRPTKPGSALRKAENDHIEHILSISRNSTHAAFCLGVTLRSLYIRIQRGELKSMIVDRESLVIHPLSRRELSLREFRALVVQNTVRNSPSIAEASKTLGTSVKTIYVYMDSSRPETRLRRKSMDPKDLPIAFKDQKPDIPIKSNQRTLDKMEVSVSVDPEERDHYYNLDFPWGVYSSKGGPFSGERKLHHALGYGEDS